MKKRIAMLLAVIMLTVVFAACGNTETPPASPTPDATPATDATPTPETTPEDTTIKITDMTGREITLDEAATRIVAVSAADCEIIYALGAGDYLIGRGSYCNYPLEVLDKPEVESGAQLNVEQVLALNPQVVIMSGMAQSVEQVEALEAAGIKVIVIYAQDIAGVYEAIGIIGQAVGKDAEAGLLVSEMQSTFAEIEKKATGDGSETVYFEVSPLERGLWTAGSNTFMDELATMLGLTNVFNDVADWAAISEEQVIDRDPDYIVSTTMYFGEGPMPVDEILGRTGWENMKAIKNGKVMNADNDEITRPGPRLMDAVQSLYDFVYGE